jgi:hypothetical protein
VNNGIVIRKNRGEATTENATDPSGDDDDVNVCPLKMNLEAHKSMFCNAVIPIVQQLLTLCFFQTYLPSRHSCALTRPSS